jgi:hypothetical protein
VKNIRTARQQMRRKKWLTLEVLFGTDRNKDLTTEKSD